MSIQHVDNVEILSTCFGGPGPNGMKSRVVRLLPSEEVWRVDFIVTDGKADPQVTKLDANNWAEVHEATP